MSAETFVATPAAGIRARRRGAMEPVLRAAALGLTRSVSAQWPEADPIQCDWMLRSPWPGLQGSRLRDAWLFTTARWAVCTSQAGRPFHPVRSSWSEEAA